MSEHDQSLWEKVIATVTPYTRFSHEKKPLKTDPISAIKPPKTYASTTPRFIQKLEKPLRQEPLDDKTLQRLRSGKTKINGKIDLHGMTKEEAHKQLILFINDALRSQKRWLIVITGKGTGALKTAVPKWLDAPKIKPHIRHIETASKKHGGDGAYYICLRKHSPS